MTLKISFCTTCKGRLHHLRQTLPRNMADNPSGGGIETEFVVLDYNSPDGLEDWIKGDPAMRDMMAAGRLVFARNPDPDHFRMAHAKNMAHRLATGDIVCNLDADNFTGVGFARHLGRLFGAAPDGAVVRPDLSIMDALPLEARGAFGRIAVSRTNFTALGGYDESIRGWGGEDTNFLIRARALGLTTHLIERSDFLHTIAHGNEERFSHSSADDRVLAQTRIANAGLNFSLSSLKQRFAQVSGWAQANGGQFGMGTVYRGLEATPVTLGPAASASSSWRPAILGAPFYFAQRFADRRSSQATQDWSRQPG